MELLLPLIEVEEGVMEPNQSFMRPSHRRLCPPLYSGRAGYKLQTLMRGKDFLALDCTPAAPVRHYPKWVPVRHRHHLCRRLCLCHSWLSRAAVPVRVLSVASRALHVPARARHAPARASTLPARSWHAPLPTTSVPARALRHSPRGLMPVASSVAVDVDVASLVMPRGDPLLAPAQTRPA